MIINKIVLNSLKNNVKKVVLVFGTRPEAIKLCPLVKELEARVENFEVKICVTAQHREMLDQVLSVFDVKPHYDFNIMKDNQTLADVTSVCVTKMNKVLENEKPDILVVQGDTTTTFVSSLAAYYSKVPVGHVEAGLRTYNKYSPFPEEINRRLTSAIADIHFAPTQRSRENLLSEGVSAEKILVTGNTVIDALLWVRQKTRSENRRYPVLEKIDFQKKIILVTGHRRENFGVRFANILAALRQLAEKNENIEIVYPVHLNPNVKEPVYNALSGIRNIALLEPLDYEPFIYLMDQAYFIVSDSGGIQEEAPSLGKPVLVTRNTTERPEAVDVGVVRLVGTDQEKIYREAQLLLDDKKEYKKMSIRVNPYGDGHASERIVDGIIKFFRSVE